MKKIIQIVILSLLVSSCCTKDPIETARYELTPDELALLPYTKGEKINFIHSNGYPFDFYVAKDKIEWKTYNDFCEWHCCGYEYFSYQVKTSILESAYPKFEIIFSLGDTKFHDNYPQALNIKVNNRHFIQFPYDSLAHFICDSVTGTAYYDSVYLNNQMFYKVVKRDFDNHYFINDSSALVPMSVYFNNLGLIQLKMSNHETFTINN